MGLESDINKFMNEYYEELPLYDIREPKVIHLTKIGTHHFSEHEIALLDTPVVQRTKVYLTIGTGL